MPAGLLHIGLGDLFLGEGLPEHLLPVGRLVPRLHPGEERLQALLARRRQHERVEVRELLAALGQRLPPRPRGPRSDMRVTSISVSIRAHLDVYCMSELVSQLSIMLS